GDGNTATRRQTEARLHQLVGKNHRGAQAATTERLVDQARNFFFLQRTVQDRERQSLGQNFGQQGTANRGLETLEYRLPFALGVLFVFVQTNRNAALQLDFVVVVSTLDFGHVREEQTFALAIDALAGRVIQTQHDIL